MVLPPRIVQVSFTVHISDYSVRFFHCQGGVFMFTKRLNETRKQKGFTAQNMADYLSVSLRTYRHYESGHTLPTIYTLVKIADKLDVSTDYLLCRDNFLAEHAGEH